MKVRSCFWITIEKTGKREVKMDITLALGGGGSRGYAHIGVLRRLEQAGIRVRAVAGTSAGGIVAAAYALGHSPDELETLFSQMDQSKLFGLNGVGGPGILGLSGAIRELEKIFGDATFEDLDIPCAVVAVDINAGQEVHISSGRVVDALLATSAVPGVFPPRIMGDCQLVDGAVLNPVPVSVARDLAPKLPIIAVVLESVANPSAGALPSLPLPVPVPAPLVHTITRTRLAQAFNVFIKSVDLGSRKLAELRLTLDRPDVIIRPDVKGIGLLDSVDIHKVIRSGEVATEAVLPELKQLGNWSGRVRQWMGLRRVEHDTRPA
jgi:NTE family protein